MADQTTTVAADDHRHGWNADDGLVDLLCVLGYGAGWVFFTLQQMASTQDSVFGLLQSNVTIAPNETASEIQAAYNGTLDRNHLIGFAIALSVQLFLTTIAFPSTRALLLAHRKTKTPSSASTGNEAANMARWQKIVTRILISADIITDFYYAISGHNLFAGTFLGFIPALSGSAIGVLLVGLIYPIAICGATIYFGNIAFKRLGSFVYRIRANTR